jgi:hypothetical protein
VSLKCTPPHPRGDCEPCDRQRAHDRAYRRIARGRTRPGIGPLVPQATDHDWWTHAACAGRENDEPWFPEALAAGRAAARDLARRYCRTCPVMVACARDALDRDTLHGIRAGVFGLIGVGSTAARDDVRRQLREVIDAPTPDREAAG